MLYWIWLTQIPYVGIAAQKVLLSTGNTPKQIYQMSREELISIKGINRKQADYIYLSKDLKHAEEVLTKCKESDIHLLCYDNEFYDPRAKTHDSPILLYYRGNLRIIQNTVGIVGARRCSQGAKKKTAQLTKECVDQHMAIVSGMAKGIDAYAHTACIMNDGYPIAILGNGLDICYPSEHKLLMQRIIEKGIVLSEYHPGVHPSPYTFPRRNRLIAAWSDQLYVIEPGKKSGSLITEKYASEYGRKTERLL